MGLLGVLLARRAGCTYEQLLSDRITRPLGLSDTQITLTDRVLRRLTPPYNAAQEPEKNWDFKALAGAGAVRSTARDLLRFAQANIASDGPLHSAFRLAQEKHCDTIGGPAMGLGLDFRPRRDHSRAYRDDRAVIILGWRLFQAAGLASWCCRTQQRCGFRSSAS